MNSNFLIGASKNNQNRLHLGFHYPRDIKTVYQCIDGFEKNYMKRLFLKTLKMHILFGQKLQDFSKRLLSIL